MAKKTFNDTHHVEKGAPAFVCFLCFNKFQFGEHIYNGRMIDNWKIKVCEACMPQSCLDIEINNYPHLKAHLKNENIEVKYNEKGFAIIPSSNK